MDAATLRRALEPYANDALAGAMIKRLNDGDDPDTVAISGLRFVLDRRAEENDRKALGTDDTPPRRTP